MAEAQSGIHINQTNGAAEFGPTPEDIQGYQSLLGILDDPANAGRTGKEVVGFSPRINAETTSDLIDRNRLGSFINQDFDQNGLDASTHMRLSQQRFIAGALGLRVGEQKINSRYKTAGSDVLLPRAVDLPPLPTQKNRMGKYVDARGMGMSRERLDGLYAAHFIASNAGHFSKKFDPEKNGERGAFEELFERVVEQAEAGSLEVRDKVGFVRGAASLARQAATLMGYNVGEYTANSAGVLIAPVTGVRPGFTEANAHFMYNGVLRSKTAIRY